MAKITHPAVDVVRRTEKLWNDSDERAGMRAQLIVSRLIETGYLEGTVESLVPLKKDTP